MSENVFFGITLHLKPPKQELINDATTENAFLVCAIFWMTVINNWAINVHQTEHPCRIVYHIPHSHYILHLQFSNVPVVGCKMFFILTSWDWYSG